MKTNKELHHLNRSSDNTNMVSDNTNAAKNKRRKTHKKFQSYVMDLQITLLSFVKCCPRQP
jgi:hypothetical protein